MDVLDDMGVSKLTAKVFVSLATDMAGTNQLCPIDNDVIMNR